MVRIPQAISESLPSPVRDGADTSVIGKFASKRGTPYTSTGGAYVTRPGIDATQVEGSSNASAPRFARLVASQLAEAMSPSVAVRWFPWLS